MNRLFLISFLFFLNSYGSEKELISVLWKNPEEDFVLKVDKTTIANCDIFNMVQDGPLNLSINKIIDCSDNSSKNFVSTIWNREILQKSFEFLKDPQLEKIKNIPIDELNKMQLCIDYLSPNKAMCDLLIKRLIEILHDDCLSNIQTNCIFSYIENLNNRISDAIGIEKTKADGLGADRFRVIERNLVDKKSKRHYFRVFSDCKILKLLNLCEGTVDSIDRRSIYQSKTKRFEFIFGTYQNIILTQYNAMNKTVFRNITYVFPSKNIRYFDGSGLKGNEGLTFIFSKQLSQEMKEHITQEVEASNNHFPVYFYRSIINHNPINLFYGFAKRLSPVCRQVILTGAFLAGSVGPMALCGWIIKNEISKNRVGRSIEIISRVKNFTNFTQTNATGEMINDTFMTSLIIAMLVGTGLGARSIVAEYIDFWAYQHTYLEKNKVEFK